MGAPQADYCSAKGQNYPQTFTAEATVVDETAPSVSVSPGVPFVGVDIGGFFGAWLGGVTVANTGDYHWMWYADILLALFAALINLPIREARVAPRPLPQPA